MLLESWQVEFTNEFGAWWETISSKAQAAVDAYITMLEERGPTLSHPYSSKVVGSRHAHMRELRVQHAGRPIRIFYAFDPRRVAILLIGGDKTGDDRFYERMIPTADRLYDEHLEELKADSNQRD
jgi:hypothetical protein